MQAFHSPGRRSRFKAYGSVSSTIDEDGTESTHSDAAEHLSTTTLTSRSAGKTSLIARSLEESVFGKRESLRKRIRETNRGPTLSAPASSIISGRSMLDVLANSKYQEWLSAEDCFSSSGSSLDCYVVSGAGPETIRLTDDNFSVSLDRIVGESCATDLTLIFFADLVPTAESPSMSRVSVSQLMTTKLFSIFDLDPGFLPSFLGHPDYGAPQSKSHSNDVGVLESFSLSLQHPRWGMEDTGLPLSVHMKRLCDSNVTVYVVAAKEADKTVQVLQNVFASTISASRHYDMEILEIHGLISRLSIEMSKTHVEAFQRYTREKLEKLDDCFDPNLGLKDRTAIDTLTKDLPVIAYNADAFITAGEFASINARKIRDLDRRVNGRPCSQINEMLSYIIESMAKQRLSFESYKTRKDITMDFVSNLLAQEDVATNLQLVKDTKSDSSSMNVIALMTIFFLPGTFIANVLSANIFSATAGSEYGIEVSRIWWFWIVVTIPLTAGVMVLWCVYQRWPKLQPRVRAAGQTCATRSSNFRHRLYDAASHVSRLPARSRDWFVARGVSTDEERAASAREGPVAECSSRGRHPGAIREGSATSAGAGSGGAGSAGGQSTGMPSLRTGPQALSLKTRSSPRPGGSTLSSGERSSMVSPRDEKRNSRFTTEPFRIANA